MIHERQSTGAGLQSGERSQPNGILVVGQRRLHRLAFAGALNGYAAVLSCPKRFHVARRAEAERAEILRLLNLPIRDEPTGV